MITSHNVILPKYLRIVKKKGSGISKTRARVGWGKGNFLFLAARFAKRNTKFGGDARSVSTSTDSFSLLVGMVGLEPTASTSRT